MSRSNRTAEEVITLRHARSCRNRDGRCTCEPTYRAEVYDAETNKRIHRTFPTITAARRWRQNAYAALRAGTLTADRGPTLAEATEDWLAAAGAGVVLARSGEPYKPAAIRSYEQVLRLHVLPALGDERLREITLPQLQRFVDRLAADGLAPATITTAITPLRAIYRRARQLGEVHTNPVAGVSVPSVDRRQARFATAKQVEAMIAQLDAARDRALWAVAIYAGLRKGEITALHREDVDLASGVIRVERGWDRVEGEIAPKSRQGRRKVPIPAVLRDHLDAYLSDAPPTGRIPTTSTRATSTAAGPP